MSVIAGKHIIIECEGEHAHLSEQDLESILSRAADAAGASILASHFHRFGPRQGVTGVLVLAESHITVHTWPEYNYAAFDVFMCGVCEPDRAVEIIITAAKTIKVKTNTIIRGTPTTIGESNTLSTGLPIPEYLQTNANQEHRLNEQEQL